MKKFKLPAIVMIIVTFGCIQRSDAQKQSSGLYLIYNDYVHHKLSYTPDPANPKGDRINIHEFIGHSIITVISGGKKIILPKSTVFGYHDAYNNDYRFCDNKAYQIIDTTGFYIYSFDKLVQQGKGPKETRVYFFSKKDDDAIFALTPANIAVTFPKNNKFKYMVEVALKSDLKLDAYDDGLNEYRIKELYAESLK